MDAIHTLCKSFILFIILSITLATSIKMGTTPDPKSVITLNCEKCFGHGVDGNKDPRCSHGCDPHATISTSITEHHTVETNTPIGATTELPPDGDIDINPLDYAWDERKETSQAKKSTMLKLIPLISEKYVPLITQKQTDEYSRIIELIKALKAQGNTSSTLAPQVNSMFVIIALCAMTLIVVLIILLFVIYTTLSKQHSRTPIKTSSFSLPTLKIEEV